MLTLTNTTLKQFCDSYQYGPMVSLPEFIRQVCNAFLSVPLDDLDLLIQMRCTSNNHFLPPQILALDDWTKSLEWVQRHAELIHCVDLSFKHYVRRISKL
jgi:hypothetical protein